MTMRAGDRKSARVPLSDLDALHRNWETAYRLPVCRVQLRDLRLHEVSLTVRL